MNDFKEDDGSIVELAAKLQYLKAEKENTLDLLNKLDKTKSQYLHDKYTYENKITELGKAIQDTKNELSSRLGEGEHKYQLKNDNSSEILKAEISIINGYYKVNVYNI